MTRRRRFGAIAAYRHFVPEHRCLTARIHVAPVETGRGRELFESQLPLGLNLLFGEVVKVDPRRRRQLAELVKVMGRGPTVERRGDGAVISNQYG